MITPFIFRKQLSLDVCKRIIEESHDFERFSIGETSFHFSKVPSFLLGDKEIFDTFVENIKQMTSYYLKMNGLDGFQPADMGLEVSNVKFYSAGEKFDWHSDAVNKETFGRALGFLFYLNDDYTGGETEYKDAGEFSGKAGDVLVFPPFWSEIHRGKEVITGTKWIMTCYLRVY